MTTRTNYIFVDFENTQDIELDLIADKPVKVFLILGGKQERLPVALVKTLIKYSSQIQVIETEQTGNHALDFVLACQIGVQSVADPKGYFHIFSRDKGFDAVILHLREQKILGARHEEFAKIPVLVNAAMFSTDEQLTVPTKLSATERVTQIAERLSKPKATRPAKRKTLFTYVAANFKKLLSDTEVEAIIAGLVKAKVLSITTDGKVEYPGQRNGEIDLTSTDHKWTKV